MKKLGAILVVLGIWWFSASHPVQAALIPVGIWNGKVGLSIDAVGSNGSPVGDIQANIPAGATVLAAYLYSAGTPYPWYPDSPTTLADYNSAGISLAGNPVTTFNMLVGATALPARPNLGTWYTGRADVTGLVQSLHTAGPDYTWEVREDGPINNRIDGEVLAIVYTDPAMPEGSVVLLDGGQATDGETTTVNFADPLGDVSDPEFFATMSLGISFSTGDGQHSTIDINGNRVSSAAGGYDDGHLYDGGLLTAGGIGDTTANPADPFSTAAAADDELYDLTPWLSTGAAGFTIQTTNPSDDDNIFFMGLHLAATVSGVNEDRVVPEPGTMLLLGTGLLGLGWTSRVRRKS